MAFHDDSFQVWESHCLLKSSVPLTKHQSIGNRGNLQINDTDKGAYSHIHPP